MEYVKFTTFCLIVMGDVKGAKDEIVKISESPVNFLSSKTIIIATFISSLTTLELNEYFKTNKRNYIIFEMTKDKYGAYLKDKDKNKTLFEDIIDTDLVNEYNDKLISKVIKSIYADMPPIKLPSNIDIINGMSSEDRDEMINRLIDKGVNGTLTKEDEDNLKYLTK